MTRYDEALISLKGHVETDGVASYHIQPPTLKGRPLSFQDLPSDSAYKASLADTGAWLPEGEAEEFYRESLFCDWIERQSADAIEWLRPQYEAAKEEASFLHKVAMTIKGAVKIARTLAAKGDSDALADHLAELKGQYELKWPRERWKRLATLCQPQHDFHSLPHYEKTECPRCKGDGYQIKLVVPA